MVSTLKHPEAFALHLRSRGTPIIILNHLPALHDKLAVSESREQEPQPLSQREIINLISQS